jgi:hypothetical protein
MGETASVRGVRGRSSLVGVGGSLPVSSVSLCCACPFGLKRKSSVTRSRQVVISLHSFPSLKASREMFLENTLSFILNFLHSS